MKLEISLICGAVGAFASVVWGPFNGVLIALIAFISCDYITGVAAGAIAGKLSSRVGFIGLLKKVLILLIVGLVNIAGTYLLDGNSILRDSVCLYYIGNEGISILENLHECGVKYPVKIEKLFESWRDDNNE